MTFKELGLSDLYIERLTAKGINEPTEIQKELFGPISKGESVLGLAKTGTGKTLSYLAPLVERYSSLETDQEKSANTGASKGASVWVLVPTRELATQVKDTYELLTHAQSQVAVVVGGESEDKQIDALGQARFVVATPGRLLDLLQRKKLSTQDVEVVVMDEADRLLDMGFIDDIRAILRFLQKKPQLCFVSATLHLGVEEVAFEMGIEPKRFGNAEEMPTVEGLDHGVSFVGDTEKFHALAHFIFDRKDQRGIIFSNYRERAHEMASRLRGLGCKADALSAQLNQSQRSKIVEDYRGENLKVLVASDLAARGLDFFEIEYVVNFDLPEDPATYVHRVGRTARAGRNGKALSFIGFEDSFRLEKLERFLGKKLQVEEMDVAKLSGSLPRFGPRPEGRPDDYERSSERPRHGNRHDSSPQGRRPQEGGQRNRQSNSQSNSQSRGPARSHGDQPSRNQPTNQQRNPSQSQSKPAGAKAQSQSPRPRAQTPAKTGFLSGITKALKKLFGVKATPATASSSDKQSASGEGRRHNNNRNRNRSGGSGNYKGPRQHSGSGESAGPSGSRNSNQRRHHKGPRPQGNAPKPKG